MNSTKPCSLAKDNVITELLVLVNVNVDCYSIKCFTFVNKFFLYSCLLNKGKEYTCTNLYISCSVTFVNRVQSDFCESLGSTHNEIGTQFLAE